MSGALEGLRIADFSQLVQGPNATQMLADMGADVIKIEPLHGDWQRSWSLKDAYLNGESLSFLTLNRGKRSITLNLKHPAGKEAALKIIELSERYGSLKDRMSILMLTDALFRASEDLERLSAS